MPANFKRVPLGALVLCFWLLVVTTASAQGDAAADVLARINRARANANVLALTRSAQLDAAAQGHANDLLQNGARLGHRGSDGSTIQQRIARAGYNGGVVGENWAAYQSVDLIMTFWLNDRPHIQNIINRNYREIGIGVAARPNGGLIIVTDFGAPQNSSEADRAPVAAPARPRPTQPPPKAKPKPTAAPTRKPAVKPAAKPPLVPTLPPPTQLALAKPLPMLSPRPPHTAAKIARVFLKGHAQAAVGTAEQRGDMGRMVLGGGLAGLGGLLLAAAVIGHSHSRRRRKQ